jgi:hypothetical protein
MNITGCCQSVAASSELIPLAIARKTIIPKSCSPATVWRWIAKGLEPADSGQDRIRLAVTYVGRTPHVTERDVREFFERCTEARLAKLRSTQQRTADVTDAELAAAGLIGGRS